MLDRTRSAECRRNQECGKGQSGGAGGERGGLGAWERRWRMLGEDSVSLRGERPFYMIPLTMTSSPGLVDLGQALAVIPVIPVHLL